MKYSTKRKLKKMLKKLYFIAACLLVVYGVVSLITFAGCILLGIKLQWKLTVLNTIICLVVEHVFAL
jgi:hypothetical protein